MSLLYPRLIDRAARELHAEFSSLSTVDLSSRADVRHRSTVYLATGGRHVSHDELVALREGLVGIAQTMGFPATASRRSKLDFDVAAARFLHERAGLTPAEASARDAWAFLALVLAPDVAYWRYPNPPADRTIGTDVTRHVFGRLWWRAHLLQNPGSSAERYYLLEAFGEADFDQIFARRRRIGSSRGLVRALARAWLHRDLKGLDERRVLRDSLIRLVRLEAIIDFECLDDEALYDQVTETMAQATRRIAEESTPQRSHRHRRSNSTDDLRQ